MIQNFERPAKANVLAFPIDPVSLLVEPHGGQLVQPHASPKEREQAMQMPRLSVSNQILLDCEQITHGAY